MPDEVVASVESTQTQESQSAVTADAGGTPEIQQGASAEKAGDSENGKKPIKVPESLKPKANADGKEPAWVQGRLSHYAQQLKEAREELFRLKNGSTATNGAKPAKTEDGAPSPDSFDTYQEYIDAFVDYKVSQREKATQQQQSELTAQQYRDGKRQEFQQHAAPIVEQVPDFWNVVSDPTLPVSDSMAEAVMELGELAPYTMLWLASNRAEAAKLAQMPPHAASIAIGRLAVQLERELQDGGSDAASDAPAPPQVQPKPVPQIRGNAPGNIDQGPSEKDDTKTWMIKEAERERKKSGNPNLRRYVPR